jgi:hypothetical protein
MEIKLEEMTLDVLPEVLTEEKLVAPSISNFKLFTKKIRLEYILAW